jgi:hypothetical protein
MEDLRATQERDLIDCIDGEFGDDITLVGPDGTIYDTSAIDATKALRGKIRYRPIRVDPETGETIIVPGPVVSIRIRSLQIVPADGENWLVKMPVSPEAGAALTDFLLTEDRAIERHDDMGFIKLYLQKPEQTP